MAYLNGLREEELKNKVAQDYFASYDTTKIIGNIDFCIAKITDRSQGRQSELFEETTITQSLLWAEAKRGNKSDIYESFVQLIMTIGKARTFEKHLPPVFLAAGKTNRVDENWFGEAHPIREWNQTSDWNYLTDHSEHGFYIIIFKFLLN